MDSASARGVTARFEALLLAQALEPLLGQGDDPLAGYGTQLFADALARGLEASDG